MEDYKKVIEQMIAEGAISQEVVKKYCPELKKENKDERIKQFLIHEVEETSDEIMSYRNMNKKDVLAWLKKQGEQLPLQTNERAWLYLVADVLTWKDGIGQYLDDPRVQILAKKLCNEYAQRLYDSSVISQNKKISFPTFIFDDILALQCCMETAKKVTEDKDLYEKLKNLHSRVHDAYLEKQVEQKSIWHNNDEEPYEDKQVLVCLSGNCYVDFYHKEDKRFYMLCKPKHYLHEIEKWAYIDDLLEGQGEQKTVDYSKQYADYHKDSELQMPRLTEFENELASILFDREYEGSTETDDDIAKGRLEYELAAIRLSPKLISIALKEQKSEQKPTEFRIKKGNWYVCTRDLLDNYANKAFCKGDIYLSTQDGSLIPSNSNVPYKITCCPDTYFRDWTIQDAKKGDVIFCKGNIKNSNGIKYERICLFNNLDNAFFSLTRTSNYEEYDIDVNVDYPDNTVPATKEQKEILFMVMADAGYTFDFEKKELKELEQTTSDAKDDKIIEIPQGCHAIIEGNKVFIRKGEKVITKTAIDKSKELTDFESELYTVVSHFWQRYINGEEIDLYAFVKEFSQDFHKYDEWNKEDEEIVEALDYYVKNLDIFYSEIKIGDKNIAAKEFREKVQHWIKTLKGRIQPRPQQEWSDKDKECLKNVLWAIQKIRYASNDVHELDNMHIAEDWIESFKNRYTWKPSDEQITWLYRAADDASKDSRMKQVLNELLEQLKKLKGK